MCLFFFSSRRRHTRFKCDWSSDVCSSDLEQTRLLDRDRHPFYVDGEGATAEFFLARDRRTGRAVGRVAAILNERYNRHRRESGAAPVQGFFGFFDSIDSLDVTAGLLEAPARWLRERAAAGL